MSDDPNEFRVISVYGDDPIPGPDYFEHNAVTEFPASAKLSTPEIESVATKLFWPLPQVQAITPELKRRLMQGGFTESEVERGCFMLDSKGELVGALLRPQNASSQPRDNIVPVEVEGDPPVVTPIREFRKVSWKELAPEQQQDIQGSRDAFDRFLDGMESQIVDRLYFWTSSRGDHWEKIEADSAENAAIMQAERWSQKGYRGPFTIMVSLSGLDQPPGQGDRVWVFDVNPEVLFRAKRQAYQRIC